MEVEKLEKILSRQMPLDGLILATTGVKIIDMPKLNELLSRNIDYETNDSFNSYVLRVYGEAVLALFDENLDRLMEFE